MPQDDEAMRLSLGMTRCKSYLSVFLDMLENGKEFDRSKAKALLGEVYSLTEQAEGYLAADSLVLATQPKHNNKGGC